MRGLAAIPFAVAMLLAAPAFADKDADAYYKEGLAYKQEGKIDEAIKARSAAVAQNPRHGMAWAALGSLYKQKKDLPKSIDAYEHATQIITKDAALWTNLGTAYANTDRNADAVKALSPAEKLAPKDAEVHAKLGTVLRKKNDDADKAIPEYEKATALDPGNADGWFDLGFMYKKNHDNDKAIDAWDHYLCLKHDADGEKRISEEMTGIGGKPQCKDGAKAAPKTPAKSSKPKK